MSRVSYAAELDRSRIVVDDFARTVTIERSLWDEIGCYNGTFPTAPSPGRVWRREGPGGTSGQSGPGAVEDTLFFVRDEPGAPGWQSHYPYRAIVVDGPVRRHPPREQIR